MGRGMIENGVFTAGGNTVATRTRLLSWANSARTDWLKPRTACLAPQYDDSSGMPWKATAEQTLTMQP